MFSGKPLTEAEKNTLKPKFKPLADMIQLSFQEAIRDMGEKAAPKEDARITTAALTALRKLYIEASAITGNPGITAWVDAYSIAANRAKKEKTGIEGFLDLLRHDVDSQFESWWTDSRTENSALNDVFFVLQGSRNVFLAADSTAGLRFRLDALIFSGTAAGYLAGRAGEQSQLAASVKVGVNEEISRRAKKAAAASHKDHKADREHVRQWLVQNRASYATDVARIDAIVGGKEVNSARSTIQRWVSEWNRDQKDAGGGA